MKKRNNSFLAFLPKQIQKPIYWCFIVLLILTVGSVVFYPSLQYQIPIFYSLTKSTDQLVSKKWIFLFPSLCLAVILINTALICLVKNLENIIIKLFAWATFGLQIILAMIFIRLILIIY